MPPATHPSHVALCARSQPCMPDRRSGNAPGRRFGGKDVADIEPCLVERVTADFARNFGEQLTLRDIESASGYSIYQIIRAFRRRLGTTPHAYFMRMRIDYAATRLAQGDSIAGAAAEAGFADQSHMTRHFKRVYGTTPKQYMCREQRRTSPDAAAFAAPSRAAG